MGKPTMDMSKSRQIYAMIEYGPPAIQIFWNQIAPNYHFNIKEKLKAAGYESEEGSFGQAVRYVKKIRKVV